MPCNPFTCLITAHLVPELELRLQGKFKSRIMIYKAPQDNAIFGLGPNLYSSFVDSCLWFLPALPPAL